jgi:hypothetical protein
MGFIDFMLRFMFLIFGSGTLLYVLLKNGTKLKKYSAVAIYTIIFVWLFIYVSPEQIAYKEAAENKKIARDKSYAENKIARESLDSARLEGIKALQDLDTAIRDDISSRRNALEKAAVKHEHNNGQGQPTTVDLYTMKDGRLILCTTSISSTGAIMNCDGEP